MPYEKREMIALFGQDYVTYTKMVPAFIPSGKVVYGRSNSKPSN
jgi:protein-S-isoprenylcysteine O-methyltransferase Ste14